MNKYGLLGGLLVLCLSTSAHAQVDLGAHLKNNDFNDIKMGAGVGLRYMTPFGPLRLDVAVPLDPYDGGSRYAIYAGIGQSF